MKFYALTNLSLRSFTTLFQLPEKNRLSGKPEQREVQYGPSETMEPILSVAQNVAANECVCPQHFDIIFQAKKLEIANAARKSKRKIKKLLFRHVVRCIFAAMSLQRPGTPVRYAESRIVGAEVIRYEDGAHIIWYLKDGWQGNIGEFAAKFCEDLPGDIVRSWEANLRFLEQSLINPGDVEWNPQDAGYGMVLPFSLSQQQTHHFLSTANIFFSCRSVGLILDSDVHFPEWVHR